MKVAVIGATGFVGGYLVDALLDAGHGPSVLVRAGSEAKLRRPAECRVTHGDLSSETAIAAVLDGCDAVIYNVGLLREFPGKGITFEDMHYAAAVRVIDAARRAGISRFLLMSANGVKRPGTPYQETKFRAEEYLRESGLDFTIFRPSVIFGDPHGTMEIATQLYRDMIRMPIPAVRFHNGLSPLRDDVMMSPVHARDVADAFVNSLGDAATFGKSYDLGGPEALSWGEMLRRIARAVGKKKVILPMPITAMKLGAALFDWLPFFPATRDQLTMLAEGNTASPDALVSLIQRPPVRFSPANLSYLSG
jgi:NADH dehydrogenase